MTTRKRYIRTYLGTGYFKRLEKEVRVLLKTGVCENEFICHQHQFSDYPEFHKYVQDFLSARGLSLCVDADQGGVSPRPNTFELQRHTVSVLKHTDDASNLFCLVPLDFSSPTFIGYCTRNVFRYHDENGMYQEKVISDFSPIVFCPTQPHEFVFCGDKMTLALCSAQLSCNNQK